MAEYIYRKGLNDRLKDFSKWCRDGRKEGVDFVLDAVLPDMPSADVVQRTEVAREIFAEIEECIGKFDSEYNRFLLIKRDDLAELKKKYTEEQI